MPLYYLSFREVTIVTIFISNSETMSVLGILENGKVYSLKDLTTTDVSVLKGMNQLYFNIDSNNQLDMCALDSDMCEDTTPVYKLFNKYYLTGDVTSIILSGIDNELQIKVKMAIGNAHMKEYMQCGITLEDLNKMLRDRAEFEKFNTDNAYFMNKLNILKLDNMYKISPDNAKSYINTIAGDLTSEWENKILMNEDDMVYFTNKDGTLTPDYDYIAFMEPDSVDEFAYRNYVPSYHKYIGGYVNYSVGPDGSVSNYSSGEYIKDATTAAILNDCNYRKTLEEHSTTYNKCKIGNDSVRVDLTYIRGNSEYDEDDIRENEKEYYDALCNFVDECLERDILEANVDQWTRLGLDIDKYIPNLKQFIPLGKINPSTGVASEDKNDVYTLEKLAELGLTKEVFKNLNKGTPTSNRWFAKAINVALAATRAYTGKVTVPAGYDSFEFIRGEVVKPLTIQNKFAMRFNDRYLYNGREYNPSGTFEITLEDGESVPIDDVLNDLNTDQAFNYWYNIPYNSDKPTITSRGIEIGSMVIRDNTESFDLPNVRLDDEVVEYCISADNFYACPEALIKCLRFGRKKPESLYINGAIGKLNLTTGEVIRPIEKDKPREFTTGHTKIIKSVVVSDAFSPAICNFLKKNMLVMLL